MMIFDVVILGEEEYRKDYIRVDEYLMSLRMML